MPTVNDMFPSKYLRAADCDDGDLVLTIRGVNPERIGQDDKWIVLFRETDKTLVLNKTNTKVITKLYGDDTDNWVGQQVTLFGTEVDFQGDMVPAIRIRSKVPKKTATGQAVPKPTKPATEDDTEDVVPF